MTSTIWVALAGLALAACGGGDEDGACAVRVLDPCPGCGSGEVVRAAEGESLIVARADGGYIGACRDAVQWHARDFSVEDSERVALPDEAWSIQGIAGGEDLVFAYLARELPAEQQLVAIGRGTGELWRVDTPIAGGRLTASGEAAYLLNREAVEREDAEDSTEWWRLTSYATVDGTQRWTWRSPEEETGPVNPEPIFTLGGARFSPREDGGGVLEATLDGTLDLGEAGMVASEDSASIVSIEMGAAGVPSSAEIVTALPSSPTGSSSWWRAPDGRVAVRGDIGDELVLPGGVVLHGSDQDDTDWYLALLGPDGIAEWGMVMSYPDRQSISGIAFVGGALVVAGTTYKHSSRTNPADAFVMSVRDGAVEWKIDATGDHPDWTSGIYATPEETAVVSIVLEKDTDPDRLTVPMLTFGSIALEGPTAVVVELLP